MKFTPRTMLFVLPAVLLLAPLVRAEAAKKFESEADVQKVRTSACNPAMPTAGLITPNTPPETKLFNVASTGPTCPPVLAPDGHQITLGEFGKAKATARVKCTDAGTHSVAHFSGLIPGGTYSFWQFIYANGTSNMSSTFTAAGAVGHNGTNGPIENFFTASADGEGELSLTTPAGPLSAGGALNGCWLDNPEVHLELVYHIDGLTHGPVPGPGQTWVFQAVIEVQYQGSAGDESD